MERRKVVHNCCQWEVAEVKSLTTMAQRSWHSKRSNRNSIFSRKALLIRSVIKLRKLIILPRSCA